MVLAAELGQKLGPLGQQHEGASELDYAAAGAFASRGLAVAEAHTFVLSHPYSGLSEAG